MVSEEVRVDVHFVWPGCRFDAKTGRWDTPSRRVFWVAATPEELPSEGPLYAGETHDDEMLTGRYLWFVPEDLIGVVRWIRVYPVSGMWNGRSPWLAGPSPVKVASLEELAGLDTSVWATGALHTPYLRT